MYSTPGLRIYVAKDGSQYRIQRFMEHPQYGYSQSTGDFIELNRQSFLERGAGIVVGLLSAYPTQMDLGLPPEAQMSAPEKRRFHRDHLTLMLDMPSSDAIQITLMDMDKSGDSGRGRDKDAMMLRVPFSAEEFTAAIDAVVGQERGRVKAQPDVGQQNDKGGGAVKDK